jgi:ribosomal protein S18 acetylase RimI-like enzyme
MTVEPFRSDDISPFLKIAAFEGWVAEPWEFEFLLSEFPQGCCVARGDNGETAGFVTSLLHMRSGWIGNLIVAEEYRGRGIGGALFKKALEELRSAGAQTIWLTASKSGAPLYEKHGFSSIDTIVRWVGTGRQRCEMQDYHRDGNTSGTSVSGIDCQAWGDRREALLAATIGRGRLLFEESGFAVIQPCGDARQLGPFTALDSGSAERLFDAAFRTIPFGAKIYLDSPVSNRASLRMFSRRRMRISGSSELMYAGLRPDYRPELLYGLATMGSCG